MTTIEEIDPRLDAHIRRTLREVARTIPTAGAPADARGRVRRARRWQLSVAAAVALLAAIIGAAVVAIRESRDRQDVATAPNPSIEPQRLILERWPGELLADDSPVPLPLGGLDRLGLHGPPQPLPDGRHVALGVRDVTPPPVPDNEFTDVASVLVVVGADGEVEIERELPQTGGELLHLLAATADEAILLRVPRDDRGEPTGPSRLVAHDLQSGQERPVVDESGDPDLGRRMFVVGHAVSNTLVVGQSDDTADPRSPGCSLVVIDLTTGEQTPHELSVACSGVDGVHLSPNGALVGIVYSNTDASVTSADLRLAIVDLATSTMRSDEPLGCNEPITCPGEPQVEYLGMAWDNDTTVRVALVNLVANPNWNPEGDAVTENDILVETRRAE